MKEHLSLKALAERLKHAERHAGKTDPSKRKCRITFELDSESVLNEVFLDIEDEPSLKLDRGQLILFAQRDFPLPDEKLWLLARVVKVQVHFGDSETHIAYCVEEVSDEGVDLDSPDVIRLG